MLTFYIVMGIISVITDAVASKIAGVEYRPVPSILFSGVLWPVTKITTTLAAAQMYAKLKEQK